MLLAADIGNTNVKLAIFENGEIKWRFNEILCHNIGIKQHFNKILQHLISAEQDSNSVKKSLVFCSVADDDTVKVFREETSKQYKIFEVNSTTALPYQNNYASKTLGADRIAAVAGAMRYGGNVLVIDVGTCITFDYLNKDNVYEGGSISAGFRIKYLALNNFTGRLPLIDIKGEVDLVGKTTSNSIASGVVNGTVAEIDGMIDMYKRRYDDIKVVITGGDGEFIHKNICNSTIFDKDLVMFGLKNIFEFNAEEI